MKNSPLAVICIVFCLGIWAAKYVHIPLFFVFVSCALFLVAALASLQKKVLFSISLLIAVFLVGFLHFTNTQTYSANHISNFVSNNPQKVYVMGKVVSNPEVSRTYYGSQKAVFTFGTCDLKMQDKWQAVEGLIKATLYGKRIVQYGDKLLLEGTLSWPPGLRNPGGFNYREYLANHNIFGLLKVKEKDAFLSIGDSSPIGFRNGLRLSWETVLTGMFRFKQKLHQIIYQHLEPEQAALLSAILLGERTNLSQDVKDLFISTGTVHILPLQSRRKHGFLLKSNLTL